MIITRNHKHLADWCSRQASRGKVEEVVCGLGALVGGAIVGADGVGGGVVVGTAVVRAAVVGGGGLVVGPTGEGGIKYT